MAANINETSCFLLKQQRSNYDGLKSDSPNSISHYVSIMFRNMGSDIINCLLSSGLMNRSTKYRFSVDKQHHNNQRVLIPGRQILHINAVSSEAAVVKRFTHEVPFGINVSPHSLVVLNADH